MGYLFFLMGKSSTGKDSIYKKLLEKNELGLGRVVQYTTRPIRDGETEGEDYHFCDNKKLNSFKSQGKIIEIRTYPTILGDWSYFTVDDGQIDFEGKNLIMIGTLESFLMLDKYYKNGKIIPIYIEVEDGKRLQRALEREMRQTNPKYDEMCRRFLADKEDFSPDKLEKAGIKAIFQNEEVEKCTQSIADYIKGIINGSFESK